MKTKQVKVTIDVNLYKLLCKKSIQKFGEINLSLLTRTLYHKYLTSDIEKMIALRRKGLTFGEIGEIFGMSRQAIHQKFQQIEEL